MKCKVSVIIPTYKRPALLRKCLGALMNQDFPTRDYEVIVVTDGPDNLTARELQEELGGGSEFTLSCLSLPERCGPAAARNAGWKMAKGTLILFTDDDCLPEPGWITNIFEAFICKGFQHVAFTGTIQVPRSKSPTDFEKNTRHLETAEFVTANCACTKSALEKVDGFDESFTMAWREDSDLEFSLITARVPILRVPAAVVIHPVRQAPWGVSLREQKKSMFDALLYKKHPHLFATVRNRLILRKYIVMILALTGFVVLVVSGKLWPAMVFFGVWIILLIGFIHQRLSGSCHSVKHVSEMIATSICIPFLSVYWNLYGAFKFKVLHI